MVECSAHHAIRKVHVVRDVGPCDHDFYVIHNLPRWRRMDDKPIAISLFFLWLYPSPFVQSLFPATSFLACMQSRFTCFQFTSFRPMMYSYS